MQERINTKTRFLVVTFPSHRSLLAVESRFFIQVREASIL